MTKRYRNPKSRLRSKREMSLRRMMLMQRLARVSRVQG